MATPKKSCSSEQWPPTSSSQDMQTEFQESLKAAAEYPCNLIRTPNFDSQLRQFQEKLSNEDVIIFDERRWGKNAITFYDLAEDTESFRTSVSMSEQIGVNEIKVLMSGNSKDPSCRFIFLSGRYSRDPLACSPEQLLYILSYLQAMPAIIDHITTFCARDIPHLHTSVKVEDDMTGMSSMEMATLGRSGRRLQHCFNLIGVEHNPLSKETGPFFMRQTAAYFSFDLVTYKSTWLLFKGNEVVKERIHHCSKSTGSAKSRRGLSNHDSFTSALTSALNTHVLIFEWCLEGWAAYVEWLEERIQRLSAEVKTGEVKNLVSNDQIAEDVLKKGELHAVIRQKHRAGTFKHTTKTPRAASGPVPRLFRTNPPQSIGTTPVLSSNPTGATRFGHFDFGNRFPFDKLQSLHRLSDKLEESRLVISQDIGALAALRARFGELDRSETFRQYSGSDHFDLVAFIRGAEECVQTMAGWQVRIQSMSSRVNQDISLFNATLQFRDMRTNEFFLHQSKISTDVMERLTIEMAELATSTRHETYSMHVITILTLIFLPGTFVATFFSSGILDFDDFDSSLPTGELGGFSTRWAALKLFGAICLPLMGATLSAWAFVYFLARRRQQIQRPSKVNPGRKDLENEGD